MDLCCVIFLEKEVKVLRNGSGGPVWVYGGRKKYIATDNHLEHQFIQICQSHT